MISCTTVQKIDRRIDTMISSSKISVNPKQEKKPTMIYIYKLVHRRFKLIKKIRAYDTLDHEIAFTRHFDVLTYLYTYIWHMNVRKKTIE